MINIDVIGKRCYYCLTQLDTSFQSETCSICTIILAEQKNLVKKFADHKQIIIDFLDKYKYSEITIDELFSQHLSTKNFNTNADLTIKSRKFKKMYNNGIIVGGTTYWAIFKPYYQTKVNYVPMRKITGISKASTVEKDFIRKYWQNKYHLDIGEDWEFNVKLSFISYKRKSYQELSYDYPSSVFGLFVKVSTESEIEELCAKLCTSCKKLLSVTYYCRGCKAGHCSLCRNECFLEYEDENFDGTYY